MSANARPVMKTNQNLLEKVIPQSLEKLINTALKKLKNAWFQENTLTGIQFYGDMDE